MIAVSDVRAGMAVRLDGKLYKVLEAVRHSGSGQMHGFIELKLRDIRFGHFADRRFKHTDRLEEAQLSKRQMQFLYGDTDNCYFMDQESFEQVAVTKGAMAGVERFLREEMKVTVELVAGEAVSVDFPKVVEIRVGQTGPGVHGAGETTMKTATLENGLEILVPHFIETGDLIRVETEKVKYIDRVTAKRV